MTLTIIKNGETRTVTDAELVEEAFRETGLNPERLGKGFIRYWLDAGKSIEEILAIAGAPPCRRRA